MYDHGNILNRPKANQPYLGYLVCLPPCRRRKILSIDIEHQQRVDRPLCCPFPPYYLDLHGSSSLSSSTLCASWGIGKKTSPTHATISPSPWSIYAASKPTQSLRATVMALPSHPLQTCTSDLRPRPQPCRKPFSILLALQLGHYTTVTSADLVNGSLPIRSSMIHPRVHVTLSNLRRRLQSKPASVHTSCIS